MHPWLRELETISMASALAGKHWVRQAFEHDGKYYLVCSSSKGQSLLECKRASPADRWTVQELGKANSIEDGDAVAPLAMPMAAAAHGRHLLVCDYTTHRVVIMRDGRELIGALTAPTMRQPTAVATDGRRAFVAGERMMHVFDLEDGECTDAWPTASPETGRFNCDHGLAIHRSCVLAVDGLGCRVHVFSESGEHLRAWGGSGSGPGCFLQPWGCSVCNDHVLVSEKQGKRVQIFSALGAPVGQLYPDPDGCGDLAGTWVDEASGRVLIADWDKHCVRVLQLLPLKPRSPNGVDEPPSPLRGVGRLRANRNASQAPNGKGSKGVDGTDEPLAISSEPTTGVRRLLANRAASQQKQQPAHLLQASRDGHDEAIDVA